MAAEQNGREYLSLVLEKLKKRIGQLGCSIAQGEKEIEGMHEYYWENYTEMDQYGYENYDNQQALLHQVNANREEMLLLQRLRRMQDAPFFGRVDFCYEGDEEPEIFYIGIGNFAEKSGSRPLIYDWRAPVSGLFYDYDKGPASYEAPGGEQTGEITAKWQYKIRGGRMLYEFESDIKIDDEILKSELGGNGGVQLKNIIRTIQKEQNAIIRNTKDRILVIQGAAGSGKTSVALHRIAYLLYHDRQNLKSSNVLILSPNGIFSDYISHILPELGEEPIQEMSFDLFAYRQLLGTVADCEDRWDQIEKEMRFPELSRRCAHKQTEEFAGMLEGFILELEDRLMNFSDVSYKGFSVTEAEILDLFYNRFSELPLLKRMDAVGEYFIDGIETLRNADMEEDERELVRQYFLDMYETQDLYEMYSWFLEEYGYGPLKNAPLEKRNLLYEDVYPLLYLKFRLLGTQEQKGIRHLIIDEMQDYSWLQYRIIRELFACRMTILGDRAQTIGDGQRDVTRILPGLFGRDIRIIEMQKSYRNTVEIARYAGQLTQVADVRLFERHGRPVQESAAGSYQAAVREILKEQKLWEKDGGVQNGDAQKDGAQSGPAGEKRHPYETAAVIVRTEKEAGQVYQLLKEGLEQAGTDPRRRLFHLNRNSGKFCKGLTVTTYYLAKGLEFDQVFLVFPKSHNGPADMQARYIGATRALHELFVYSVK